MKKIVLAGNATAAEILYGYFARDERYKMVGMTVDDDFTRGCRRCTVHLARSGEPLRYSSEDYAKYFGVGL